MCRKGAISEANLQRVAEEATPEAVLPANESPIPLIGAEFLHDISKSVEVSLKLPARSPVNDSVGEFGFHARNIANSDLKRAWLLNSPTLS